MAGFDVMDGFGAPLSGAFGAHDDFVDQAFGGEGGFAAFGSSSGAPRAGAPHSGGEGLFRELSDDEAGRLARAFEQVRGADGFVHASEGRVHLQRTGLSEQLLQSIWNLSDLDRDGRLSLREFACAQRLAEQARAGRELPVEVRPEQQERLSRSVERHLTGGGASGAGGGYPEAPDMAGGVGKPARHEELSTVDTAATDLRDLRELRGAGGTFLEASDFGTANSRPGHRGLGAFDTADGGGQAARPTSLGQLASVLEAVARLDASGELRRLSREVLEERKQLEGQLARRREFETQLRESRGQLDNLREERRRVEADAATAQRRIAHLQEELGMVEREVRQAEEDLHMLRESSGLNSAADKRAAPHPYTSPEEERRDVISKVRAERELLQRDQKGIAELRGRLDTIFKQKLDAQLVQQSLLEKQRQTEQDRGLMLTAIEAERGKLSAMRAERIKLWEERSSLEREMGELMNERWLLDHLAPSTPDPAARGSPAPATTNGALAGRPRGVREGEQLPGVVMGSFPDEDSSRGVQPRRNPGSPMPGGFSGGYPVGGSLPAPGVAGGFPGGYGPDPSQFSSVRSDRDFASNGAGVRQDARGVRNEPSDAAVPGGWSTFGDRHL